MPTKPSILLPIAGRLTRFADRAVAGKFVLLGEAEIEGLIAEVTLSLPKKMPNNPSKSPEIFDRNGVMSGVPSGMPVVPTTSPPFFLISAA